MEESDELSLVGSASDEEDATISWLDEYCRNFIHSSTPHTYILTTSCGDQNWENEFPLLVSHEG